MHLSIIRRKIRLQLRRFNKITNRLFSRSYFKAIAILFCISLINFYSVATKRVLISQILIFITGTVIAVFVSNVNYSLIKKLIIPFYTLICSLIILIPFIGIKVNGARRWLKFAGFTIQPTELLKLAIILVIALYLQYRIKPDTRKDRQYNLFDLIIPLILTILPLIIILKQPDLGTAIICLLITSFILFFMGIGKLTFIFIIFSLFGTGFIGWKHLKPYQKDRIINFLNPDSDYRGKNWQAHQSMIAFGSGGIYGRGIGKGPETQLGFLPERETDFAIASIGEEHGFVFIFLILLLINYFIVKVLTVARNARDKFSAVVAIGIAAWIGFQTLINVSMVIGLLPIVGIPMPIISSGGSSLLSIIISLGVLANIEHKRNVFQGE